jgi:transposase
MAPTRRTSLAVAGHTPALAQRGRHRDKVSVAGAVCVSPLAGGGWGRERLYFETFPGLNVDGYLYAGFARSLVRRVRGPIILVHDRLKAHGGEWFDDLLDDFPWLQVEPLPPYAPDLNPADAAWAWVKGHALANFAPRDVPHLDDVANATLRGLARDRRLLRSFLHAADLPW